MKKIAAFATLALLAFAGCSAAGSTGVQTAQHTQSLTLSQPPSAHVTVPLDTSQSEAVSTDEGPEKAYCEQTGGAVQDRKPVYGTNGPNTLLLAGSRRFCRYRAHDGSRIYIELYTLYTTMPSLAATAYIGAPPLSGNCQGNPASCYCTQLGGSDQFGGTTAAGGGWYLQNSVDQVLEACIFPDMSSIDSWGLAYHSAGIIRGIDLTKVMRFHESS